MKLTDKNLLFTQCKDHEFGCNSGLCIPLENRCDEVADCDDLSDESNCELVIVDFKRYRKEYPPIKSLTNRTEVTLSIEVLELGQFQELKMTFWAKFNIKLKWFDSRLTFTNLKENDAARNSISESCLQHCCFKVQMLRSTKISPLMDFLWFDNKGARAHLSFVNKIVCFN